MAREDALIGFASGDIFGIRGVVIIFCKYFGCKKWRIISFLREVVIFGKYFRIR